MMGSDPRHREVHVTAPTVLRTRDVDLARARVADFFCDHRLDPVGRAHAIDMRLRIDTVGSMGLVHLDYGEPVQIRPGPLATFYLVQILSRAGRSWNTERRASSPRRTWPPSCRRHRRRR